MIYLRGHLPYALTQIPEEEKAAEQKARQDAVNAKKEIRLIIANEIS